MVYADLLSGSPVAARSPDHPPPNGARRCLTPTSSPSSAASCASTRRAACGRSIGTPSPRSTIADRSGTGRRLAWPRLPPAASGLWFLALVGLLAACLAAARSSGRASCGRRRSLPGPGYDAIVLRPISDEPGADLDVVVGPARRTGADREATLTAASLPDGRTFLGSGLVSQDGWLALGTSLTPGSDEPVATGPGRCIEIAIGPGRRSSCRQPTTAVPGGGGHRSRRWSVRRLGIDIQIVDPDNGTSTTITVWPSRWRAVDLVMTEDGSGVGRSGTAPDGSPSRPIDGGPVVPDVPRLAPSTRWESLLGRRWLEP